MDTQLKSKWIEGFEGLYSIREDGMVRSYDKLTIDGRMIKGRWLKPPSCNRYHQVTLHKDGVKTPALVHRLVANAFIPNPDNLYTVNHKDEIKHNNNVSNLEWMTLEDNTIYTNAMTHTVRCPSGAITEIYNMALFCKEHGLNKSHMSGVINGKRSQHKGWTRC